MSRLVASLPPLQRSLLTLALSLLGVLAFWLLHLPLPFLFGPMFEDIVTSLVDAFSRRARDVYADGDPPEGARGR